MLKHSLLALTLSCLAGVGMLMAQDNSGSAPPPPANGSEQGPGRGHFDPARRTEMLTKRLNLNSDQQAKVSEILKSQQDQMEKLHSDTSLSQDDRRAKMMDLRKSSDDQIRAVLDADQQKKWDKMMSERGQWQGHRPEGGNAPPPPSSN